MRSRLEPYATCDHVNPRRSVQARFSTARRVSATAPSGVEDLPRRHVLASGVAFIGKETNRQALLQAEENDATVIIGVAEPEGEHEYLKETTPLLLDELALMCQRVQ